MYELELTYVEFRDLAWLSARYESARVLFDGKVLLTEATDDEEGTAIAVYSIPEHVAWQFVEACEREDGGFVPCCAGTLGDKLIDILQTVV